MEEPLGGKSSRAANRYEASQKGGRAASGFAGLRAARALLSRVLVSTDSLPTVRLRTSMRRVVIVHDDPRACLPLLEALQRSFAVSLALDADELADQMPPMERLTCVVGVLDASTRARDIHATLVAAGGTPQQIVLVTKEELVQSPEVLDELIDVVRRLGASR